jgi:hypothetical protein
VKRSQISLLVGLLFSLLLGLSALAKERRPGTLTVTCDPPAVVRVDGKRVGLTPLRQHALRSGAHQIELSNATLGAKRNFQVIVNPGKDTKLVVDLHR